MPVEHDVRSRLAATKKNHRDVMDILIISLRNCMVYFFL
jgi:hypothetical protein